MLAPSIAAHQEILKLNVVVSEKEQQPAFSQVRVDRETFNTLERQNGVTGLPKVELLARLVGWFDAQPPSVQQVILRRDDAAEEIWRLRQAEKLARGEGTMGIKDIPAAVQQIRELADRIEIFDRARRPRGK